MSVASADIARLMCALFGESPENHNAKADASVNEIQGEQPSFDKLLHLFHKKIYNFAYRLLGDFDEAADLTQETFLKAFKAYRRFDGPNETIYPWLCKIAVNNCKNKFRELNRKSEYEVWSLDDSVDTEESSATFEIGDDSNDPAGVFEKQDLEAQVQDAIQELPAEFKVIVILRDMQGLSYKEIAEITGISIDLVKVRLYRGRGILRRRFAPYISE